MSDVDDVTMAILNDLAEYLKSDKTIMAGGKFISHSHFHEQQWIDIWYNQDNVMTILYFDDCTSVGVNTGRILWETEDALGGAIVYGKEQVIMFPIADPEYRDKVLKLVKEVIDEKEKECNM